MLSLFSRVKDFKERSLISDVHATCFTREEQKMQIHCSASPVRDSEGKTLAVIFVTHNSKPHPSKKISSL
jgi:DNA-binding IclR family transcriptional regulator